jgi:hypothetical protein
VTGSDSDGFSRRDRLIAELVGDPEVSRWAHDCGWMPGTGMCRNRACEPECLFREQRRIEAAGIEHLRRQRRPEQRAIAERKRRLN